METAVLIVSVFLIAIVLLQSSKAESADIIGSSSQLFQERKERGLELFISRLTFILGFTFFVLCIIISFM